VIRTLYRAWLEFTSWLAALILWLFLLQGQVYWWQPLLLWVTFMVLFFLTRAWGYDPGAMPFTAVLALTGWAFLTRLNPTWATAQFWGVLAGSAAYLVGIWVGSRKLSYPLLWASAALGLVFVTALVGESAGGARAWLRVGGLRFQPVELARIALVIYLAQALSQGRSKYELYAILTVFFSVLAWQRDLGPALLVFFVFAWMSLAWKFTWPKFLLYLAATAGGFAAAFYFFPHLRTRAIAWLRPWDYLDSKGYQILQGLFALRSGGLVGQGLGEGMDYVIPQVHTDYLFAVIGEEFGLLGTLALLVAYLSLAFWAMQLLQDVPDQTLRLTGLGLSLLLHIQVFMVVGGILRIVPFSGMTLPLVSYGSTSLVAQLALLGLVTGLGQKRSVE
jgi:cell division protein FtsW (lipid II flippase)